MKALVPWLLIAVIGVTRWIYGEGKPDTTVANTFTNLFETGSYTTNLWINTNWNLPLLSLIFANNDFYDYRPTNVTIHARYPLVDRGCDAEGYHVYEFNVR